MTTPAKTDKNTGKALILNDFSRFFNRPLYPLYLFPVNTGIGPAASWGLRPRRLEPGLFWSRA